MTNISNPLIVGCCGIVCSGCESFTTGTCNGCRKQESPNDNCPIMECCIEHQLDSCAKCEVFISSAGCDKLSDVKNLNLIREIGLEEFLKSYIK